MGGANAKAPTKRRALTPAELEEARQLRSIYESKKRELRLTQEKLAELMGFGTQGAVSQYLRGRIPMSNEVLLKFAYHLEFNPCEIRPDIFEDLPLRDIEMDDLDNRALHWARRFARLSEDDQKALEALLDRLDRAG